VYSEAEPGEAKHTAYHACYLRIMS
jgi:hypothetical protein